MSQLSANIQFYEQIALEGIWGKPICSEQDQTRVDTISWN